MTLDYVAKFTACEALPIIRENVAAQFYIIIKIQGMTWDFSGNKSNYPINAASGNINTDIHHCIT